MRVLVVDDEKTSRVSTARQLAASGFDAEPCECAEKALERLEVADVDVVLTDLRMPNMDGLELMREIRKRSPTSDVIVMTAYGTVETAVEAMQLGAADYLTKPFPFRELEVRIRKLEEQRAVRRELAHRRAVMDEDGECSGIVGRSPGVRRVCEQIRLFAGHDAPVLIVGETGTGKELVARALHVEGTRSSGPFVAVSCGTIPRELAESELLGHEKGAFTGATKLRRGRFEHANGGTLLLDDVDDLPLDLQVKLLRVLQEGRLVRVGGTEEIVVDMRVVATTKRDLANLVQEGKFRDDLFYRLRGLEIHLPPLRARGEDVLLLARYFLSSSGRASDTGPLRIAPAAADRLLQYHWPGNVRELRRTVEAAAILCEGVEILYENLPEHVRRGENAGDPRFTVHFDGCGQVPFQEVVQRFEDEIIDWALRNSGGRQAHAAELLQLPRTTLQSKLARRNNRGE